MHNETLLIEDGAARGTLPHKKQMQSPAKRPSRRRLVESAVAGPSPDTCTANVTVLSPLGLHLRPAAFLAKFARRFDCDIALRYKDRVANVRSLLSIVVLQAPFGASVLLTAQGRDAAAAMSALAQLFDTKFGESAVGMLCVASAAAH